MDVQPTPYTLEKEDTLPFSSSYQHPSPLHHQQQHHHQQQQQIELNDQMLAAMPRRQKIRYENDYYTPKWVRYTGHLKEGYCDLCQPGKWLQLKNSAYWYHKQFYHGISSVSGQPFLKPLKHRLGKGDVIEGLCHQCHRYVSACNGKKKNNYMLWYRHAHKCHIYDKPNSTKTNIRKLSNDTISTVSSVSTIVDINSSDFKSF
ncbi:hypothetical protein BDF20DRAFT_819511 [Mycotypha africana]|uniref:uncharacterized protein n=1 Tax=Mycotypha africana TaxID=64632 RepID=UPI002300BFB4|nr:uncharacterized protein BDF20DRAFT_819511 [Mycotypha africana]KAI8979331.1 hypothetical protein BDF20DRAFT_819511 [Mycotypha africana]